MVLRKLAVALLSAGVLLPGLAHALAIGDIKTKSALNQPYVGEVLLTDVGDLSADEIRVDLATQDEFKQMGVERTTQLADLRFAVIKQPDGTAVIRVTSVQPVTEPDLDFVLRVSWPGNTSMREFVALLDLPSGQVSAAPVMQPAVTAPVVAPVVTSTEPEAVTAPAASMPAPVAEQVPKTHAAAHGSGPAHYRPRQGEGLWSIALKHRPSHQVTVQQTMMAIEKANPAAFPTGNVNLIEAGHTLVIPPLDEIRRMGVRESAQAVVEQDQAWHGGRQESTAPAKPLEAAQINATAHQAKAEAPVAAAGGQVHLVAPGRADKNKLAAADASLARDNEKKAQAEQLENARLKAQIDSDKARLQAQQEQLALQDKKLAELQAAMKAQPQSHQAKPALVAAPPVVVAVKPAAEVSPAPVAVVTKPAPAATAVIKAKPVSIPPQPVAKPDVMPPNPPVPVAVPAGPNIMVWGAGGIAALAALVGGLIAFRRHRDQKAEVDRLSAEDVQAFEHDEPIFSGLHEDDHAGMDDFAIPESLAAEPAAKAPYDALQDAEDFLARGRYPQAAGILTRAIEQEPERSDLRLRLMECQVAMGDAEGFAEQEQALEEMGDLDALDHAESLRAKLPSLPMAKSLNTAADSGTIDFSPAAAPAVDAEAAMDLNVETLEDMEFDFSQSLSQTQLHAVDDHLLEQPAQPEGDLELPPLDLDLDDDFQHASDASLKAVSMPVDDHHDDLSLGFEHEEKNTDLASFSLDTGLAREPVHDEAPKAESDKLLDLGELALDEGVVDASPASLEGDELHDLDFSLDDLEAAEPTRPHDPLPVDTLAGLEGDDLSDMDFDLESLEDLEASPEPAIATGSQDDLADPLRSELGHHQADHEEMHGFDADADEHAHTEHDMDADLESMELDNMSLEDFAALETPSAEYDLSVVEPEMASAGDTLDMQDAASLQPVAEQPADDHSLDLGDDFDFLADADENATKLDLAKAYMDMGDLEGARDILQEVLAEGSSQQQEEARGLLLQAS